MHILLIFLLVLCCHGISSFIHSISLPRSKLSLGSTTKFDFFATTVSGLEDVLAAELKSLPDITSIEPGRCGVHFCGSMRTGLAGLMNLRTSLKLMELIADDNRVYNRNDLFGFIDDINWSLLLEPQQSLKVDTLVGLDLPEDLTHSHYTSLTVKNAIVDQFRRNAGVRPNVDIDKADLPLLLYLHQSSASLYRVWSGCQSMHKRGYRTADNAIHKAALRETTAAALLILSGWSAAALTASSASPASVSLVDPMCGSGTIAIEAALMSCDTAPGLLRYCSGDADPAATDSTGSSVAPCPVRWKDLRGQGVQKVWSGAVEEAQSRDRRREQLQQPSGPLIRASDFHSGSLLLARQAAARAGVDHRIRFDLCSVDQADPPPAPLSASTTVIVTNPPWDQRLSEGSEQAWTGLGHFARRCGVDCRSSSRGSSSISDGNTTSNSNSTCGISGAALYVLTGNEDLPPLLGLSRGALKRKHTFHAAGTRMKLHEYR